MSLVANKINVENLGLIDYGVCYQYQQRLVSQVAQGREAALIICEHAPVITLGRMTKRKHILADEKILKQRGVTLFEIDRGGDVTLHAPGQLVVYPILNLNHYKKDLHWYLHQLEEVIIATLNDLQISTHRSPLNTGAWIDHKKIASVGIGIKKWITYHGVAININTDLNFFSLIKPCGLDADVTSAEKILGRKIAMSEVKESFVNHFEELF